MASFALEDFRSVRGHLDLISDTIIVRHTKIIGALRTWEADIDIKM
jgi:hypothetical protein